MKIKKTILVILGILLIILLSIYVIYRLPLNNNIPNEMQQKVDELNSISKTKLELAENVYDFVNNSYNSTIRGYLKEPNKIFMRDTKTIWELRGTYMPSHIQNNMAKEMLLLSERFQEEDFIFHQNWCQITPHEWYEVNINGKSVAMDIWFADNGGMFNCYTFAPCGVEQIRCL